MKLSKQAKEYLLKDNRDSIRFYLNELGGINKKRFLSVRAKMQIKGVLSDKLQMHNEIQRFIEVA